MATREVNEAKRAETRNLIANVEINGWTVAELQQIFGVTRSCISGWRKGRNMAPNDTRQTMHMLPSRTCREGAMALAALLAERAKRMFASAARQREFAQSVEASDPGRAEYTRSRAAQLESDAIGLAKAADAARAEGLGL